METGRKSPLLHEAELKLRRRLRWTAVPVGVAVLALVGLGLAGFVPERGLDFEIYKLLLQFFLITAGGGVLLAIVGNVRDAAIRRQVRAADVHDLDRKLDRAYRALRRTKHSLRAQSIIVPPAEGGAAGPRAPAGFRIRRAPFEAAMAELVEGKLEFEVICDHIGHRDDVLRPVRLERMRAPLRYANRYYHDVYEDYEHRRYRVDGKDYVLEAGKAPHLTDYLRSGSETPPPRSESFNAALERIRNESGPLDDRSAAVAALVEASPGDGQGGRLRYADAAGACVALLAAELADARRVILS